MSSWAIIKRYDGEIEFYQAFEEVASIVIYCKSHD
jgi:hypothetical protein